MNRAKEKCMSMYRGRILKCTAMQALVALDEERNAEQRTPLVGRVMGFWE